MSIKITCPYCNCKFNHIIEREGDHLIYCPEDEHEEACGKQFLVEIKFKIEHRVFKLVPVTEW